MRWDVEGFLYLAVLIIGVPLSMLDLWYSGGSLLVAGVAALWLATVTLLILDLIRRRISRTSAILFFAWAGVGLGYGTYIIVVR